MGKSLSKEQFGKLSAKELAECVVKELGPAYESYAKAVVTNSVRGSLLTDLDDESFAETLQDLGISNLLHCRVLTHEWKDIVSQQFKEVRPLGLDSNVSLLERNRAAEELCSALLNTNGKRHTPVLDQCFGAGKTHFVWKFRQLLLETGNSRATATVQPGFEELRRAVYVHVCFQENDFCPSLQDLTTDQSFCVAVEKMFCTRLIDVIERSLGRSSFPTSCYDSLDHLEAHLRDMTGETRFLFHFDDVGAFELKLGKDWRPKILCWLWIAAERLRRMGHYFVLSGRSSFLHLIGNAAHRRRSKNTAYEPPNRTLLIALNTLSVQSAGIVFKEAGASAWMEKDTTNIESIHILTGGVPRALAVAAGYLKVNPDAGHDDLQLQNIISKECPDMFTKWDDDLFRHLVEMNWAGIAISPEDQSINGEALASILARFGLYTSRLENDGSSFQAIHVPLYQLRSQNWAPPSLLPISQYTGPEERLEAGFRRVLCLRLSILEATSWGQLGLPYLDPFDRLPFPTEETTYIFVFPEISSATRGSMDEVADFMRKVHETGSNVNRQVFSDSLLPTIAEHMLIGQIYIPQPRSGSADTKIRIDKTTMLDWQFKNFRIPISEQTIKEEAEKCTMSGWTVFLVIFCTAGHDMGDGNDCHFLHNGVVVVVLSRRSVGCFLGKNLLENIDSQELTADQSGRVLTASTPLKRKFQPSAS